MWTRLLVVLITVLTGTSHTFAQQMPPLPAPVRPAFAAVGVVNHEGLDGPSACSGVLIAPDRVLTAAHCVWGDGPRYFMPGGIDGGFGAFLAKSVHIHPDYTKMTDALSRYRVDLAIMRLSTPIDLTHFSAQAAAQDGETYALVGFHRGGSTEPMGRLNCIASEEPKGLALGCPVVSGNSGGAVIDTKDGAKTVVAIAVAKLSALALVAPVDDWVLRQVAKDP